MNVKPSTFSRDISRGTFLLAKFLSLKVNDQWKRIWCDVANVYLDGALDIRGYTPYLFRSQHRQLSVYQSHSRKRNVA